MLFWSAKPHRAHYKILSTHCEDPWKSVSWIPEQSWRNHCTKLTQNPQQLNTSAPCWGKHTQPQPHADSLSTADSSNHSRGLWARQCPPMALLTTSSKLLSCLCHDLLSFVWHWQTAPAPLLGCCGIVVRWLLTYIQPWISRALQEPISVINITEIMECYVTMLWQQEENRIRPCVFLK